MRLARHGISHVQRSGIATSCRFTLYMPVLYKIAIEGGRRVPWLPWIYMKTSHG